MKKITNPTDKDIKVQIKGKVLEVLAKGELSGVTDAEASYWKDHIHKFILVGEDTGVPTVPAKDEEVKETADVKEVETKKEEGKEKEKESTIAKVVKKVIKK